MKFFDILAFLFCLTLSATQDQAAGEKVVRSSVVVATSEVGVRPLLPSLDMMPVPGFDSNSKDETNSVFPPVLEPRPCQTLPKQKIRRNIEGYTLANALLWLLSSPNVGQRQYAYRMLSEVVENINLHGADDFDVYDAVFCGEAMILVAGNVVHDAFIRKNTRYKQLARSAIIYLGIFEALPAIEKGLQKSNSQIELIQLMRLWLSLKLDLLTPKVDMMEGSAEEINKKLHLNRENNKKHAAGLIAELKLKINSNHPFQVVQRALKYYQARMEDCGNLCPEEDMIELDTDKPSAVEKDKAKVQERKFFLNPMNECPPDETLHEMQEEQCPLRSS